MYRFMRVLMTCCEYPPVGGGASAVVKGLAEELAAMGHRVDLLTMRYDGQPRHEIAGDVRIHRVPCVRLRLERSSPPELLTYLAGAWPMAQRLLRESRATIIHSHFIFRTACSPGRCRDEPASPT